MSTEPQPSTQTPVNSPETASAGISKVGQVVIPPDWGLSFEQRMDLQLIVDAGRAMENIRGHGRYGAHATTY